MTDAPPPEAVLSIPVADLDGILEDVRPGDESVDDPMQAGYHAGQVQAADAMHRAVIERADIQIE